MSLVSVNYLQIFRNLKDPRIGSDTFIQRRRSRGPERRNVLGHRWSPSPLGTTGTDVHRGAGEGTAGKP